MFEPKREEVRGQPRKLHIEDPHNLYSLPDDIRVIESAKMRSVGHLALMVETRDAHRS